MRRRLAGWMAWIVVGLVFCPAVPAESGINVRGSGGWGAGLPYGRHYDPATVGTLKGEVVWVKKLVPFEGMSDGLHLLLKTRDESIPVHLGPFWYLERQDFSVDGGDSVEITGSRVNFEGMPAVIAIEVKKPDKTLLLREANGFPLWSAWRRR